MVGDQDSTRRGWLQTVRTEAARRLPAPADRFVDPGTSTTCRQAAGGPAGWQPTLRARLPYSRDTFVTRSVPSVVVVTRIGRILERPTGGMATRVRLINSDRGEGGGPPGRIVSVAGVGGILTAPPAGG